MEEKQNNFDQQTKSEKSAKKEFLNKFKMSPIFENEMIENLYLYIKRQELSRILMFNELYQKILHTNGDIFLFGTWWGRDLALLSNLRGIYEPFNYTRKIVAFDTFSGFKEKSDKDNHHSDMSKFQLIENYDKHLDEIIDLHESFSPISHVKKHQIVKGDVLITLKEYLDKHPETIIAFAYFDLDLYEPTKKCLELTYHLLVKGAVVGFDELNLAEWQGETAAFKEFFKLQDVELKRFSYQSTPSYFVV